MFAFDEVKRTAHRLKQRLLDVDGYETLRTPCEEEAHFVLLYDGLEIGRLWLSDGKWHFEYSGDFKHQSEIEPLVDFPNLDKEYESEELWPFFALRIPSPQQPSVKKIVEDEELDEHNEAQLLRRFGQKTIANPFCLEPAY